MLDKVRNGFRFQWLQRFLVLVRPTVSIDQTVQAGESIFVSVVDHRYQRISQVFRRYLYFVLTDAGMDAAEMRVIP